MKWRHDTEQPANKISPQTDYGAFACAPLCPCHPRPMSCAPLCRQAYHASVSQSTRAYAVVGALRAAAGARVQHATQPGVPGSGFDCRWATFAVTQNKMRAR